MERTLITHTLPGRSRPLVDCRVVRACDSDGRVGTQDSRQRPPAFHPSPLAVLGPTSGALTTQEDVFVTFVYHEILKRTFSFNPNFITCLGKLWRCTAAAAEIKIRWLYELMEHPAPGVDPFAICKAAVWPLEDGMLPAGTPVALLARPATGDTSRPKRFHILSGFETRVWKAGPTKRLSLTRNLRHLGTMQGNELYLIRGWLACDLYWTSTSSTAFVHLAWNQTQMFDVNRETIFAWF